MKKLTSTQETMSAAMLSRRSLLKASAALGAVGFASPLYVKNAFSSSGELNFMGWAGYPALGRKSVPGLYRRDRHQGELHRAARPGHHVCRRPRWRSKPAAST